MRRRVNDTLSLPRRYEEVESLKSFCTRLVNLVECSGPTNRLGEFDSLIGYQIYSRSSTAEPQAYTL